MRGRELGAVSASPARLAVVCPAVSQYTSLLNKNLLLCVLLTIVAGSILSRANSSLNVGLNRCLGCLRACECHLSLVSETRQRTPQAALVVPEDCCESESRDGDDLVCRSAVVVVGGMKLPARIGPGLIKSPPAPPRKPDE